MTRLLSRILDDLRCGGFNEETERLFAYHQATKHTYQSVRTNAHYLDWRNQPNPFRAYEGARLIDLPSEPGFPETGAFAAMASLAGENHSEDREPTNLDITLLSRLLWHSMAVSAWKKVPRTSNRYSLRVNPSSGNLHPTETYLALQGVMGLDDGLYHYRADLHALELRRPGAWTRQIARDLLVPSAAETQLVVALTSIFWREAWKYRDRAYRYCCHDLGHALMSLLLAARALGLSGGAVAHFADLRLTRALGLTGSDEAPLAFLVFPSHGSSGQSPSMREEAPTGTPNELSTEEIPYELLSDMHRATLLPDSADPPPLLPASHDKLPLAEIRREPARDAPLAAVVRRRRSALDFNPDAPPMESSDLEQLLDFATRDWRADWRGNLAGETGASGRGADFVTLHLYVHRVRDCEPGVYRWDGAARNLQQLHRGNVERVAAYLSLEQPLAGNACFAVSMIADLAEAARRFGNRGYRYVYFEAGAIGQRLYIGAEALGWNATGIGAFYDDDVHRYLGFLDEAANPVSAALDAAEEKALVTLGSPASRHAARGRDQLEPVPPTHGHASKVETALPSDSSRLPKQVIYHFAVGRAIADPRLEA